tara:strand:+ start:1243 stop:2034 length:792 start_codon:yes stop_codon:yes gene_type:complete
MKKLLLLSALLIFACSSDDSSDNDDNNNNNNTFICDGAPYQSIVYGTQEWTVENACHTTYRDGTPIPHYSGENSVTMSNLTTGAWCYYDNDPTKYKIYNWFAVAGIHDNDPNTPNKEFAPEGWHVPTDAEWTTLKNHLIANGYNYDSTTTGNKIAKSMSSTTDWLNPTDVLVDTGEIIEPGAPGINQSLNNSSGFNAFPEGHRSRYAFANEGYQANFWSSTEAASVGFDGLLAWRIDLRLSKSSLRGDWNWKRDVFSVRLVKD